ncbi:MAG TPA: serine/threonine-protein kinase [Thermoanaerobaculia bacterium]|nr:serine/threonine-protein kinase [Thermoanaerobaculia bacterium]
MSDLVCLRCHETIDSALEACPHCGEQVTSLQRTYAGKLLDGKYQILERLGVGGMGEIFKVRHIHLNELRVIKIMRPNIAQDDSSLQRFLQEARTSTQIKHRNLAMLYDFAQLDDGSYYMVWEFIDGTNIQKWIQQQGAVPARLTVEIAIQAVTGLDHLHSMGLIHRDISPENIMLSQDHHGKLLVKVIDFGIAKQLTEGEGGQGLTQTGMFLGKLKYASPEQAGYLKDGEHLDPRSDLYSFGIVMYEMLAGRAPFNATTPHGYILKHVTEKPAPLPDEVPPKLGEIIMKSLEKQRQDRHESASEFAGALESIRQSIPPDAKYGLGERMVTLSGAQTLAEMPKMTAPQVTAGGAARTEHTYASGTIPGGTIPGGRSQESTLIERAGSPRTIGSNEATVVERLGGAAPTATEPKWTPEAESTVIERQIAPPKKNTAMIAGIAAAVVIAIIATVWAITKKDTPPANDTAIASTAGTELTTTTAAPIPGNQGMLLLSASPWGDLDRIVRKSNQQEIPLTADDREMPSRITLAPGEYTVTVNGPKGPTSIDVQIQAGQPTRRNISTDAVDFNELENELTRKQ